VHGNGRQDNAAGSCGLAREPDGVSAADWPPAGGRAARSVGGSGHWRAAAGLSCCRAILLG